MNDSNPLKSIREKCVDCMCGQQQAVKMCPSIECPLYPFRLGKNPYRKRREITREEKDALSHRLKDAKKSHTNSAGGNDK